MPLQHWTAAKREGLKPNAHESFYKSMTANILGTNNKLETMVTKTKSPHLLKSVKNLQSQLEAISAHLHSNDCAQVMCVVIPVNLYKTSEIHEKMCDLLRDYAVPQEPVVANSTTWINRWVDSKAL
jgi:hypothetical protein